MGRIVAYLLEQDSSMKHVQVTSPAAADEWLGAESHVPNLGRELRRRNRQGRNIAGIVVAGALFAAGVVLGSLAAMLMTRSRRTS